jgi:hypothetical protein
MNGRNGVDPLGDGSEARRDQFKNQAHARAIFALAWIGAVAGGCAEKDGDTKLADAAAPDAGDASINDAGPVSKCGPDDNPERGLQGDVYPNTVNCGLTLLSTIPFAGSVDGAGHCAYIRAPGTAPYTGGLIRAFSLADPFNPVKTDEELSVGGSESMRAQTVEGRSILVSGRGVYDVSKCEDIVKKGEIIWPSANAQAGVYGRALSSHEIGISHNAKRVYSGLGFNIAFIDDLDKPETWTVSDWSCEMNRLSGFTVTPGACDGPTHQDVGRQYSHTSDDNLEGTVWYGANQEGSATQMERATARMVDISDPTKITILDTVANFPGHSMNWWRTPDGREFIVGANEGMGPADSCVPYPRPVNLGNALDAYIVEVTGKKFGTPFHLTLEINKPENCEAAKASRANASISAHSVYNRHGAAFVMIEYGGGGLRIFDLRAGEHPKEVAYFNDKNGFTHSGPFHYDDARGLIVTSGRMATHVLMVQPQTIQALGLPMPTDPKYPYYK